MQRRALHSAAKSAMTCWPTCSPCQEEARVEKLDVRNPSRIPCSSRRAGRFFGRVRLGPVFWLPLVSRSAGEPASGLGTATTGRWKNSRKLITDYHLLSRLKSVARARKLNSRLHLWTVSEPLKRRARAKCPGQRFPGGQMSPSVASAFRRVATSSANDGVSASQRDGSPRGGRGSATPRARSGAWHHGLASRDGVCHCQPRTA
jgi:hypothetical protein